MVFYNGTTEMQDRWTLRLSDAFEVTRGEEPSLECVAQVLNINYGHNQELLGACQKLQEYALFIAWIRSYLAEGHVVEIAVDLAIARAIDENVLRDYLRQHREEARMDILEEFDLEFHLKNERTIAYEEGLAKGEESAFEFAVHTLMKAQSMSLEEAVKLLVPKELQEAVMTRLSQ